MRSKAQIEAGQSVPIAPVLDRLKAAIVRMEARQAAPDDNPVQEM